MNIFSGVDIVEISRIKESLLNPRFIKRIFTDSEIALYKSRGEPATFLAANFAAKEAFSKAVGTGVRGFWFNDIEVLRNDLGAPYFNFYNGAKTLVEARGLSFSLSLAHEREYAVAFVVAYEAD